MNKQAQVPGFHNLSLVLLKDGGMELVKEIQVLFSTVWYFTSALFVRKINCCSILKNGSRGECANYSNPMAIVVAQNAQKAK